MVFGSITKNVLVNTFQSRTVNLKCADAATFPSTSDCIYTKNSSKAELITIDDESDSNRAGQCAYDFDEVKDDVHELLTHPPIVALPFPLPYIQPTSTKDLDNDDTSHGRNVQGDNDTQGKLNYRWNVVKSQLTPETARSNGNWIHDIDSFPHFFACGVSLTGTSPRKASLHSNHVKGCKDDNDYDDVSLLHDQTTHKLSKFFKNPIFHKQIQHAKNDKNICKRTNRSPNGNDEEEAYANLIENTNEICHDWLHRQLAFDLEYLEESDISSETVDDFSAEGPQWALQMEEISIDVPPPPPPPPPPIEARKINVRKNQMKTKSNCIREKDDLEVERPSKVLHDDERSSIPCEVSTNNINFDQGRESWQNFDTDTHTRHASNRSSKQKYRKMAPGRNRFGRYQISREARHKELARNGVPSSGRSLRSVRRRNGRRGLPILSGRQFATNLSTVTERPSEEEATSSYMPTPLSCKQRQFFSTYYDSDGSFNESEEDTAETCSSSKDSSTVIENITVN